MKAMLQAIKSKRMGKDDSDHEGQGHMAQHADDKSAHLKGIVAALSDHDKVKLKGMLDQDQDKSMQIAKGAPSSEEESAIDEAMEKENAGNALEAQHDEQRHPGSVSDDVAEAMVDHKAKQSVEKGLKPLNLGERARMHAAQQLKAKGKM